MFQRLPLIDERPFLSNVICVETLKACITPLVNAIVTLH